MFIKKMLDLGYIFNKKKTENDDFFSSNFEKSKFEKFFFVIIELLTVSIEL